MRRFWAQVMVPTLLVLGFALVVTFVVLRLSSAIRFLRTDLSASEVSSAISSMKESEFSERVRYFLSRIGVSNSRQMFADFTQGVLGQLTDPVKAMVVMLPDLFIGLFVFVLSFLGVYLNEMSIKKFLRSQRLIPARPTRVLLHSFSEYSYTAFVAAGLTAIAQGFVIGVGAAFSGVPNAFIFGMIGAISSLLPYVGTFPVSIVMGGILYFSAASTTQYVTLFVFAVFAGLIDNILRPVIVKSRSDLHPWVAFISIFGGLYFWGLAGVFIGPVLAGMSIELCREILREMERSKRRSQQSLK